MRGNSFSRVVASRLPDRTDLWSAFGAVVFIVFSWSIRGYIFKLPSLLLQFDLLDLVGVFAYMMSIALVESLIVELLLICAAAILPLYWFREGFGYKASVVVFVTAAWIIHFEDIMKYEFPAWSIVIYNIGGLLAILVILILLFHRVKLLQRIMEDFVDRLQVFLYIYPFIGVLSLFIVVLRNLN